jgi:hypothetical protein
MALVRAERVLQTSTTNGTGSLTLGDPVTGYRSFASVMSNGDTCYYSIVKVSDSGRPLGDWEVGLGTLTNATTFARTTVLQSTNGGNAVDFTDGLKYVFLSFTAVEAAEIYTKLISNNLTAITDLATDDYMVLTDTSDSGNAKRITVADVLETVDDRVSSLIVAGTGISKTYDDTAGTLTIANTISLPSMPTMQVFAANGTWNKPTGCKKIKVTVTAGGGGAARAIGSSTAGLGASGGGGAGGTAIKWINVTSISSETVTVGAGGAAATGSGAGGTGGTSSFGAHCSATGGSGSTYANASTSDIKFTRGGAGGAGSSGDINISGGRGTQGSVGWLSTAENYAVGGNGGNSIFGGGGVGATDEADDGEIAGSAGSAPGAGGGGAGCRESNVTAGYAGADGIVIVEEYY